MNGECVEVGRPALAYGDGCGGNSCCCGGNSCCPLVNGECVEVELGRTALAYGDGSGKSGEYLG